jgi:hypothetical protein
MYGEYPTEQSRSTSGSNVQVNDNDNDNDNVKSERRDTASGSDSLLCARRALKPLAV